VLASEGKKERKKRESAPPPTPGGLGRWEAANPQRNQLEGRARGKRGSPQVSGLDPIPRGRRGKGKGEKQMLLASQKGRGGDRKRGRGCPAFSLSLHREERAT